MKTKRSRDVGTLQHLGGSSKKRKLLKHEGSEGPPATNMSVDEFLSGGFLSDELAPVAEQRQSKKGRKAKDVVTQEASAKLQKQPAVVAGQNQKAVAKHEVKPKKNSSDRKQSPRKGAVSKQVAPVKQIQEDRTVSKAEGKTESNEHKSQLEALKRQDPEFYSYLLQTDRDLLAFGDTDDEEDEDKIQAGDMLLDDGNALPYPHIEAQTALESPVCVRHKQSSQPQRFSQAPLDRAEGEYGGDEDPDEGAGDAELRGTTKGTGKASTLLESEVLSQELVEKWCHDVKERKSTAALDRLVKAYRIACHLGDEEEDLDATMRITSSTVFNKILIFMIKEAGGIFRNMLKLPARRLTTDMVKKSARWRKLENIVKSFMGNSLHLLTEMTDEAMVVFMLRHLRPSIPFLIVSERLQRLFLKHMLQLFGEAQTGVRVQAILFIRQMAVSLPPPTLSLTMKGVYRAFVVNAKFMSPSSLPHINFMASCVVELYGLDTAAAYEHAFGYIRQLAVLLRTALNMKSKDSFREVYCWQTISSLDLWARLLSIHADKQELRPLVHLIAQLLIGTIRLVPTARYFPLRLRCIRALNRLSQATRQFTPVAPLLLEMLQWKGLHTAVKSGGKPPSEAVTQLRAGKQLLATAIFQQALVNDVLLLLAEHLAQWATSPAFPEMSHLILLQLRQISKNSKVEKFRNVAKGLMAAIQANAAYVTAARNKLECSPKDAATLATFLASDAEKAQAPMQKYAAVLAAKADRQRTLNTAGELAVSEGAATPDDASDLDGDMDLPNEDLLPELQKKSAAKRAGGGKGKKEAEPAVAPVQQEEGTDDEDTQMEDQLQEFELSDSDTD